MSLPIRRLLSPLLKQALQNGQPRTCVRSCSAVADSRKYIPRRAMLYVPGNDERKLQKMAGLDVDCAVMDCEDGVAVNRKEEARHTICKMLDELDFGRTESAVRVNSIPSGLAEEDLRVVLGAKNLPPTLMLPKVDDTSHIEQFAIELSLLLQDKDPDYKPNLVIFVESALGMLNLKDICRHAIELSDGGVPFQLDGIVFGSDDFCADIGATRTEDGTEILYARQQVVLIAKAFQLQAIDLVHIDFKDIEGLEKQSLEGSKMGYTGKQVIHPLQIPIVQKAFTPSQEKIEWAQQLIAEFDEHQQSGKGAFVFRGNMIDMPLVLQAKNVVDLVKAIEASTS